MAYPAVEQGERLNRPAGIRSVRLGDIRVSYVPDGAVQLKPRAMFPDTTSEVWAARPEFLGECGNLVASIGGLLVENGDRALLIDAGFGPQSWPPEADGPRGAIHGGAVLDSLAKIGRRPEEIEAVAFTHLHPDHVGWAWHPAPGGDQLAFTHAHYLVSEPEWAQHNLLEAQGMAKEIAGLAPRVRTVADGQEIFPGVRMRITAGHTSGHAEYVIASGKQRLIAFGDAMHSPIQVEHPAWSSAFDHDPIRSATHRRRLVAELGEPDTIGFGNHFADVVFGHVRRDGDGPAWRPLDA
ncbi:MBL fold metallo-hydrolase [Streptomyces montanisoli]|uniref:MBL fold metallo-hydrolase n=1 Tax=Streptomyces montanisoli TaxID=2798581 RepID=A0A940MBH8_9ACTN|nr:MBL fold metallo-hydrolase [Streptomyces montanisoli]MBP0458239.1 MBL fold metallo-hydrolase [Streptomyces montanisoli]